MSWVRSMTSPSHFPPNDIDGYIIYDGDDIWFAETMTCVHTRFSITLGGHIEKIGDDDLLIKLLSEKRIIEWRKGKTVYPWMYIFKSFNSEKMRITVEMS